MLRKITTRLSASLLSIAILVTLTFVLIHVTPGGPAYSILGMKATPQAVAAVNKQLGLDVPLWRQYLVWWGHLLQGDLGFSYLSHRPVGELLVSYELNTLTLYVIATLLSTGLAILLGLAHGVAYLRWPGKLIGGLELALYAAPSFFVATLLVLLFAITWRVLPAGGIVDLRLAHPGLGSYAAHLVLPVATVTLVTVAGLSRYFAQSVHEELGRDYVRTAAAKGIPMGRILFGHVLRNALRPLVTILGLSFPYIFAGGVVVETVFSYPGLGWLLWRSALSQDYPVLIAIVLLIGVLTVIGNLLADLVNGLLDPRASYE
jgi:peptide/nickel transport system permease protein